MSAMLPWRAVAVSHYTPAGASTGGDMDGGGPPRVIRFGHCALDEGRGVLVAPDGAETSLRPKTLDLMRLMLRHPGRVVARGEILDAVWPGIFVTEDSVTQCVMELRRAMGPAGAGLLRTVARRGYLLQAEVMAEIPPRPALAPAIARAEDRPSIAVLPFRGAVPGGARADAEDAYLEDGVIEGIVHVLSGLDRILVVSRGSALAVAEVTRDPREVGARLGVRYVLQGGLRRAGTRLRITTELSEAETGSILRTDRHEGDASDLFALQDRIAESAVAVIAPQVRAHELARALRKPPASLTAYDLVLRALDKMRRMDRESFSQARELLLGASESDPAYALACTYLAWWHVMRMAQGWSTDRLMDAEEAGRAAAAAVRCDANDALALALRAHALGYVTHDFNSALRLLNDAVVIGPNQALVWTFGAAQHCWLANGTTAVEWAQRGVKLAPLDPCAFYHEHVLSQSLYIARRFEEAVASAERSCSLNAFHAPSWRILIASLAALGRENEARSATRQMLALDPEFKLSVLAARTPLQPNVRDAFVAHLRAGGLPG